MRSAAAAAIDGTADAPSPGTANAPASAPVSALNTVTREPADANRLPPSGVRPSPNRLTPGLGLLNVRSSAPVVTENR